MGTVAFIRSSASPMRYVTSLWAVMYQPGPPKILRIIAIPLFRLIRSAAMGVLSEVQPSKLSYASDKISVPRSHRVLGLSIF